MAKQVKTTKFYPNYQKHGKTKGQVGTVLLNLKTAAEVAATAVWNRPTIIIPIAPIPAQCLFSSGRTPIIPKEIETYGRVRPCVHKITYVYTMRSRNSPKKTRRPEVLASRV